MLYTFYTANQLQESDENQVEYSLRELEETKNELAVAQTNFNTNPNDKLAESQVSKLEKQLDICSLMPNGKFMQINEWSAIQIKQQSGTSYGTYINVINEIGKVVNRIRDERCQELFNGLSYSELKPSDPSDQNKIRILKTLVPERVLEPEIIN